ncbi:MAG TPA: hypothetical protein PLD05_13985, partial [Thermogutta sp.]|nr:hypothetical protein [Thermogutta sp.]
MRLTRSEIEEGLFLRVQGNWGRDRVLWGQVLRWPHVTCKTASLITFLREVLTSTFASLGCLRGLTELVEYELS